MNITDYNIVDSFSNGNKVLCSKIDGTCVGLTLDNKIVGLGDNYDYTKIAEHLYVMYQDGVEIFDSSFNSLLGKRYTDIIGFLFDNKDIFIVCNEEGKYGVINSSNNKILVDFNYYEITKLGNYLIMRGDTGEEKMLIDF